MHRAPSLAVRALIRQIGSLWFAAVLLVLLLVAMACATVFESSNGSEYAAWAFYRAWWFTALLGLLAANIVAAVIARFPLGRNHIGFATTHGAILLILGGAMITRYFAVEGQLRVTEGQTVARIALPDQPTLTAVDRATRAEATVDLNPSIFKGFEVADRPAAPELLLDGLRVTVDRYLPDSVVAETVVNDAPHPRPAVRVSFGAAGDEESTWIFANDTAAIGPTRVGFRVLATNAELAQLAANNGVIPADESAATLTVAHAGATYSLSVADGIEAPVALGATGYTIRVLRYLPHATVGSDNRLTNLSDAPINPAVELEISGDSGVSRRIAFARFPDFQSMHGEAAAASGMRIALNAPAPVAATAPVEVLSGPSGATMHVRYAWEGTPPEMHRLETGVAVAAPWPGKRLTLHERFDRARTVESVTPADPIRAERVPALLATLRNGDEEQALWLRARQPRRVLTGGRAVDVMFGDKTLALPCSITLERFRVGYYPGGMRPRSFESRVSITDPTTGDTQTRLISMNNPMSYAGFTFYQSSYRIDGDRSISYLSVSRDPGQPIVFAGYIATLIGMTVVLVTRTRQRARCAPGEASGDHSGNGFRRSGRVVPLFDAEAACHENGGWRSVRDAPSTTVRRDSVRRG